MDNRFLCAVNYVERKEAMKNRIGVFCSVFIACLVLAWLCTLGSSGDDHSLRDIITFGLGFAIMSYVPARIIFALVLEAFSRFILTIALLIGYMVACEQYGIGEIATWMLLIAGVLDIAVGAIRLYIAHKDLLACEGAEYDLQDAQYIYDVKRTEQELLKELLDM